MAIEGGKWEMYVGGAAGAHVRKGDMLVAVDTHDEVLKHMGRFMQYYREHAKYLERTYDFVARASASRRCAASSWTTRRGSARGSTRRCEAAVDAYVDPWQEAVAPVHPSQFADALEPVGAGSAS